MLPLQQSMAAALRLSGPLGIYLEQLVWRMRPPIEARVLEVAFSAVAGRHAALRASLAIAEPDEPHLVISPKISVAVKEISLPTAKPWRRQALESFLEGDRRDPLDLAATPAWRLTLLRFAPDDAALIWTFPHALLDGRSIARILEEIAREVTADTPGQAQVNGDDSAVFSQYFSQRAELDHQASIAWWAEKLKGLPGPVEFPKDPDAPGEGNFVEEFALDESAMAPILAAADRLGVTANTLCQAAWALVLGNQSGMRDVVFLTVRACRQGKPGRDSGLCGMLMNSVPVRARLDRETTVASLLVELRRLQVEAREHELAPLEEVQRAAGLASGAGLFTSGLMVDYEDVWSRAAALLGTGHDFLLVERPTPTPLLCVAVRRSLKARLIARGTQMSEATADRMVRQFGHVLQELVRNPQARLGDLDLITPEERFRTVSAYNATAMPFPENACLHHAFETWARTSPARIAVVGPDGILTYAELEERANRIANRLIALGARPGGLVIIRL